ncbi:MAG: hypothetical protein FVQ81_02890 [Candidatus Glassbacteria bacterium]|nr:hypothetical protein [Candidatus Glassbacteria bacterium]
MSRAVLSPDVLEIMRAADVMVPAPLAVDSSGSLLESQQKLLTRYYLEAGAATVVPGTHTGQFSRGDLDLYRRWLELNAEMIDTWGDSSSTFKMAAVGGSIAFDMLRAAAEANYDLVMVAPTSFVTADGKAMSEQDSLQLLAEMAEVAPLYGFYLQKAVGGREYSADFWSGMFEIAYGSKAAPFSRAKTDVMMHAAVTSQRLDELVMVTGNDDYIVGDLLKTWYDPEDKSRSLRFSAGLLGHFASDTRAAVRMVRRVKKHRDDDHPAGDPWPGEAMVELAGAVSAMNYAVFDTAELPGSPPFECCVIGVEYRLRKLGLMFEETDIRWLGPDDTVRLETGRPGLWHEIDIAYSARPELTDDDWLDAEKIQLWKNELRID